MKWLKWILVTLRLAAKEVEEGNIGAGKKTAKGGKIAGAVIDATTQALEEKEKSK